MAYETRHDASREYRAPGVHVDSGGFHVDTGGFYLEPGGYQADPARAATPPGAASPDPDRREQARMVAVRNAVLLRMREMNSRHGMHAFDLRTGPNALGPHALAFLYRDTAYEPGRSPHDAVRAATRLFRDSDDVRDLRELLRTLANIAHQYVQRGGFDPRTVMAHRSDPMSAHAQYIGVGVSSLDTMAGEWADVQMNASSALEVPGRSWVHLIDGTRLILDRGGPFGVVGVTYSSQALEVTQGMSYTTWRPLYHRAGDYDESVWAALDVLVGEVWHGTDLISNPIRRHR
jgi:hypothetical protein